MQTGDSNVARGASMTGAVGAVWGVAGVFLIVGLAVVRLTPVALDAFAFPLGPRHWAFSVGFFAFMIWSEGYRGFQKNFAPRVAARARYLRHNPHLGHALLAPLFCMAFFHATPRRLMGAYGLTTMIVVFVLIVRQLPQPWHGLVDLGVAAGLVWGLVALAVFTYQAFWTEGFSVSPEVPRRDAD
jgi:hypothetical protein